MINLNKIYTVKSNANRDIRKAVERGEYEAGALESRKVDGGFQIVDIRPATAAPIKAKQPGELPETQRKLLNALFGAKLLQDKAADERAGIWFPFAAAHESERPHNLQKRSMAGITKGLVSRGLVRTAWGDEHIGKHVVAVCITPAGIVALQEVAA